MQERILLVDDDRNILDGYRRSLHGEFQVETAESGQEAVKLLESSGPYAVVISDMRMPGMDGIELLKRVKTASPDTVRIMLTGNADMQTAIEAINEGSIFRFLIKPCNKETMARTITAALVQYRLITAEKQLLEQTLSGCLQGAERSIEPGKSGGLQPGGAGTTVYPPRGDGDETGEYLAIRSCCDAFATGLRDPGTGNH